MVMALLYVVMFAGAAYWAHDAGLAMTWWKWVLGALWYALVSFALAGGCTLIGERERGAGWRHMGFFLAIAVVTGAVLWWAVI
jgi:hypothetical protein